MNNGLFVQYVPPASLTPYAGNARVHTPSQVKKIAASISEFGFITPIVISPDLTVIAGHGRLLAALSLGLKTVPTIEVGHLSEAQRRAYVIADNSLSDDSFFDYDVLKVELGDLLVSDFDVSLLGFGDINPVAITPHRQRDKNSYEHTSDDCYIEIAEGDIFRLGPHILACGDSFDPDFVARVHRGANVDLIFTDPMYNDSPDLFIRSIKEVHARHLLLMATMRQIISFASMSDLLFRFDLVLNFSTPSSSMNKRVPYYHHKNIAYFTESDETIFSCDNARGVFSDSLNGYYPSVIDAKKNTRAEHSLEKPVESVSKVLSGFNFSTVSDLFAGSGSTLFAAEAMKKSAVLIEINPVHCAGIIRRYQRETGAIAERFCHA